MMRPHAACGEATHQEASCPSTFAAALADRTDRLAELARLDCAEHAPEAESAVEDDRPRLMFTCCHPALAMPARVALTLRMLGGLTTAEIARAFLVSETTMGQRLVRAKRKIAAARISYACRPTTCCPTACAACWRSST
jgi:predicted RNA polymerase sigma factor